MAKNKKAQLEITADATGALKTMADVGSAADAMSQKVVGAADAMSQKVVGAGQGAGKGLDAIGASGEKAAEKISRSYGRMESEIRRVTAATQAAVEGTGRAGELLNKAVAQGLDPGRIEPMLAKLREYESRQRSVGLSSREMAFALRGIPAQFTDIATSLASGQRPLTVLLQQGGQLKDMFGGIGPAARAMGGYVAGLVNPFTVAAVAVGGLTAAWYQGSKEAQEYQRAIILTGNAVGATAAQLNGMAEKVAAATGATQGLAAEAIAGLAGTGKIAAENIALVAEAATRMQTAAGIPIAETIKQFEELGREPVKASEKLNDQANYLTESLYRQIKALAEHGKTTEAAALAQTTWANAINNRAPEIVQSLGYIEAAWKHVAQQAAKAWDFMKDVGREDSDPLATARATLEKKRQDAASMYDYDPYGRAGRSAEVEQAERIVKQLEAEGKARAEAAAQTARQNEQNKAGIALAAERDKYLTREEQKRRELVRLEETYNKSAKTDKNRDDYLASVAAVNEKYAEKVKAATKSAKAAVDEFAAVMNRINAKDSGVDTSFWKDLQTLHAGYQSGRVDADAYAEAVRNLTNQQGFAKDAAKAAAEAEESIWKAREKAREEAQRDLSTLQGEIEQQQRHNEEIGLTAAGLALLTDRRMQDAIATKEQEFAKRQAEGADLAELKLIDEQIAGLEKLRQLKSDGAARQAVADSAKAAADDLEKFSDDLKRAATDGLMRGFEAGGKDGAKVAVDAIRNSLKTAAFKIVVDPIVNSASSAIGQMFGVGGSPGGAGSSGGMNLLSMANPSNWVGMSPTEAWSTLGDSYKTFSNLTESGMGMFDSAKIALDGTGKAFGSLASYASAVFDVANGSYGKGIGTAVGTMFGGPVGAMIGGFIGDKVLGDDLGGLVQKAGGPQQGQYGSLSAKGYASSYTMSGGDTLQNESLAKLAYSQAATLLKMAGKSAADLVVQQGYKLDPEGSASGLAYRTLQLGGKTVTGGTFDGNNGAQWYGGNSDAAGAAAYLSKLTTAEIKALVDAIGDSGLSETIAKISANFSDLNEGLTAYLTAQTQQQQLLSVMMTDDEAEKLKLESANKALASTFADLGYAVPATAADFRTLIEGLDLTGTAGQDAIAQLAGVSDAFLVVANAAKAAEQERMTWQQKLDILQGKTTQEQIDRQTALEGALTDSNRALMEQVYTLQDQQKASEAAAQAQADAAAAAKSAAEAMAQAMAQLAERSRSVTQSAYSAYADMLSVSGDKKGSVQFQIDQAQAAYDAALQTVAQSAGASLEHAQQYIIDKGGMANASASYWNELGNGQDEATITKKEQLVALAQSYNALENIKSQMSGIVGQEASDAAKAAEEQQRAAAQAQAEAARAAAQAAEAQQRAQEALVNSWKQTADSIMSTVRTLRGDLLGESKGFAAAQADYAIAIAQARAGDQTAAGRLPDLARTLVDLGKVNSATSTEQALLTARTLAGLQGVVKNIGSTFGVTVPAFAVGTNRVQKDMLAMVHKDEAIIPAAFNPWAGGRGGDGDLLAELRALRAEVADLRAANSAENLAIAGSTSKAARTLERFDDGDALTVRVSA